MLRRLGNEPSQSSKDPASCYFVICDYRDLKHDFFLCDAGFSLQSMDDMVENFLYLAADLLLLGAVAAYFWKKERLSKILAVIGLGIFLVFLVAGTILALLMGGVPVFLYFYIFGILLTDGILFYLFLRDE